MTTIVRMEHVRHLRYCARGAREFFVKHDLDFSDFLLNGISAEIILRVSDNDSMVKAIVEVADGWQQ